MRLFIKANVISYRIFILFLFFCREKGQGDVVYKTWCAIEFEAQVWTAQRQFYCCICLAMCELSVSNKNIWLTWGKCDIFIRARAPSLNKCNWVELELLLLNYLIGYVMAARRTILQGDNIGKVVFSLWNTRGADFHATTTITITKRACALDKVQCWVYRIRLNGVEDIWHFDQPMYEKKIKDWGSLEIISIRGVCVIWPNGVAFKFFL